MDSYLFRPDQPPEQTEQPSIPEEGFLWLDFTRDEAADWPRIVGELAGIEVLEQHVVDSRNPAHVSFYDAAPDYEMLIFEGLGAQDVLVEISTLSAAFFLFDRLLVTVHDPASLSFDRVKQRLRRSRHQQPAGLVHRILDAMVDRYLDVRKPLQASLRELQDALLDPRDPFDDYQQLLSLGRRARRLADLSEMQLEALDNWRRDPRQELTDSQLVRLTDLVEHVGRIERHAQTLQAEIEAAVQLHFAATAHRTNEVVQTLTVLSAVFLPLTLIAGIFGMNFEHMPELKHPYAYPAVLTGMGLLAVGLLIYFRRRGYV